MEQKTAIAYYSKHHGNTKKLLDAIASEYEVTLIDVTEQKNADLSGYDRIGFASGIYAGSFARELLDFARGNLPKNCKVFFISTCGMPRKVDFVAICEIAQEKYCTELGRYQCLGWDTVGPLKYFGGIKKGHPNKDEIQGAVAFYQSLEQR